MNILSLFWRRTPQTRRVLTPEARAHQAARNAQMQVPQQQRQNAPQNQEAPRPRRDGDGRQADAKRISRPMP